MKKIITTNRMAAARCIAPMLAYLFVGGNASPMSARGSVLRCSP